MTYRNRAKRSEAEHALRLDDVVPDRSHALLVGGDPIRLVNERCDVYGFPRPTRCGLQESNETYTPLNHLAKSCNPSLPRSSLSSAPEAQV